jgi:hypothetical protein
VRHKDDGDLISCSEELEDIRFLILCKHTMKALTSLSFPSRRY